MSRRQQHATYWSPEHVDVDYEPPRPATEQLSFRAPTSLVEDVNGLHRLWKHLAKLHGDDVEKVSLTHVCVVLMTRAVASAWSRYGGRPDSEESWKALFERVDRESKRK